MVSKVKQPLVSIVIPNYNSKQLIESCLSSLFSLKYKNIEVVLVDDGSDDGCLNIVKQKFAKEKRLKIIRGKKNLGPSIRRNQGIKKAKGNYIAFFESDMQADSNWISYMIRAFEKNPDIGAAHGRVLDLDKKSIVAADGLFLIPHTGWVVSRNYGKPVVKAKAPQQDVLIGSVGTMVKKDILEKIGGYDEKLGHKVDDLDMGWKIWITGHRTISVANAITYHWNCKSTENRPIPSSIAEYYFNKMPRVFIKNYEFFNIVRYLPWLVFLLGIRALRHVVFNFNFNPFFGYIRAMVWTVSSLPDTLKERKKIQSIRVYSDNYIMDKIMVKGTFAQIWQKYVIPTHKVANTVFSK